MKLKREGYGVTSYATRTQGTRYRVLASIPGTAGIYGGVFEELLPALRRSDAIRFWAFRKGLVKRAPMLNRPEDYANPESLPEIPACVPESMAPMEKPKSKTDILAAKLAALTERVQALEAVLESTPVTGREA